MASRIEYFLKNDILFQEGLYLKFIQLVKIANNIRITLLKYEMIKESKLIEYIIAQLRFLETEEELLMTELLEGLMKARQCGA
ncbi:MAG: hypothetical protein WDZ91_03215 [Paenibacillaceae bacterium]